MSLVKGGNIWNSIRFYKAYLPPPDALKVIHYVVLALEDGHCADFAESWDSRMASEQTDMRACTPTQESRETHMQNHVDTPQRDFDTFSASSTEATREGLRRKGLRFFLCKKEDVSPPQVKQMLGKVNYCFLLCGRSLYREECNCHKAHLLDPFVWRLELNTFGFEEFHVSSGLYVYYIKTEQVKATAGFLLTCGLLHEGIIEAAQPIICRYNEKCRYGARCLFVHASISTAEKTAIMASSSLKAKQKIQSSQPTFLAHLEELGVRTVGDVQQLSNSAFDAIVAREEHQWLSQWLNVALIRDIQPKQKLENVLPSFPDVNPPVPLPPCLTTVSSLIKLTPREFYSLVLPVKVQAACEQIRARFEPDRNYNIVDLKKESEGSFLSTVCPIILSFRQKHAHVSWRKKDPVRPVVTSLITYIDPDECGCHLKSYERPKSPALLGSGSREREKTFPTNTWCTCPRSHVLAVNYELSTPSGSRCSEQNALGKLASMGLPTSAIREIFVHGENLGSPKDPNPLFPCGVCENMLRKVNRDVYDTYGGSVILYMFDSTVNPKKLVYLPVSEISYRDGEGFKKFVTDLREE